MEYFYKISSLMGVVLAGMLILFSPSAISAAQQSGPIVGRWQYQGPQMEIVADFKADGSFYQINKTSYGQEEFRGRYSFNGTMLQIQPIGFPVQQIGCRFADSETVILSCPTGEVIQARRVKTSAQTSPAPSKPSNISTGWPTRSSKTAAGPTRKFVTRIGFS